jgi:hypothetical protein
VIQLPLDMLVEAAENAGLEERDIWPFNYSGRYYARDCFGIVGTVGEFGFFLLEVAQHPDGGGDFASSLAENVATDNMGNSTIFYFPGIKEFVDDESNS